MGDAGGPFNGRHPHTPLGNAMKSHHLFDPDAEEFDEVERPDYLRAINAGGFGVTVHDADGGGLLFDVAGPAVTADRLRALHDLRRRPRRPGGRLKRPGPTRVRRPRVSL